MVDEAKKNGVLAMVAEIVSAHLSNNTVPVADIPRLIHEVYGALTSLGQAPLTARVGGAAAGSRPSPQPCRRRT